MASGLRSQCLQTLSARLGYAYRKALPILNDCDNTRFLSVIADVLDDIGAALKPTGSLQARMDCATPGIKQEVSLLTALAGRSEPICPQGDVTSFASGGDSAAGLPHDGNSDSRVCHSSVPACLEASLDGRDTSGYEAEYFGEIITDARSLSSSIVSIDWVDLLTSFCRLQVALNEASEVDVPSPDSVNYSKFDIGDLETTVIEADDAVRVPGGPSITEVLGLDAKYW